ncbi:sigma factor-like helix-turn-helix DNA-binding protein [Sphingomonas qomolangmaensis]|uniref:RNA polymerase sigma factor 70 region 4 type 2 domain-containing protein n=1 Tax=Sphingomonas qomolangmaensis TaxID=2918765 RepID=A0ABY5L8X9_9SPHN|nr:sigma factor-like helix-turn-helix DNA-binding protein [Sphingomonas qomolangmaensis]UUL82523.1 hypothetical protein NMP03_15350 [Sphingomonas qomolangmaensis]
MSEVDARLVARMRDGVAALPEPEQQVFRLHAIDGLDYAAVAARLAISVFEVERLLANALVLLARHLPSGSADDGPL